MTRHHANNILLTRNLPFDYDVKESSHPPMIPWTSDVYRP